ncbi:MAG TPA: hypothetical protein VKB38_13615 [Terracidiphilus sp.]|nr:hypothetical protein [Terracidiphilus sp.]
MGGVINSAEQAGIPVRADRTNRMHVAGDEIRVDGGRVRIGKLDADMYRFLRDPQAVIETLRKSPDRPDLFTFVQKVNDTTPRYNYPHETANFAAIPVSTYENWFEKQITSVPRNRVRQATKRGAVLREVPFGEELVRGIWEIYNETPIRQGRPYPHYGQSLESVYREESTYLDCSVFVGAYMGDELIGFIKLVWDDDKVQAGLMNILSKMKHRDKAPTNALVGEGVRACAARGIANLTYGPFAFANRERDSLTEFKENNGFKRVEVPRYYVPLTVWGAAALKLGLHHRFVDRLPEGVGHKLRDLRARWYKRRNSPAKKESHKS